MELFFILSLLLSTFLFILFSLHFFSSKHNPNQANIPLPLPGKYGWPFIGETFDYLSKIRNGCPEKFANERRSKYSSKAFKTSIIGQKMAILSGAEGNKFLYSNENKLVKAWWPTSIDKIFPKSHNKPNHEDFLNVRKFHSNFLKSDTLQKFVGTADLAMKENLKAHWDNKVQIKASFAVKKYSFALLCRLFLSVQDPQKVENLAKGIDEISNGMLSMAINFPGNAFNRAINTSKKMREELEVMIKLRKIEIMENKVGLFQDILTQMLVTPNDKGQFSNEYDIASYLLGLLHGGYGTVNALLVFIVKYLAEYPDVYTQVLREQMEILKAKGPNELLNWEDLRKMKYSWNVANEVLRLIPPIFGTFREAITDFTYYGYMIPKNFKLHMIANDTHKNPLYFPDPEKFDPTRFRGNGPPPYTFVAFGGGARMCPGIEYTRMTVLIFMHNIVTKFKWAKLILDEKVLSDPHPRPAHGLPIYLYPHQTLN